VRTPAQILIVDDNLTNVDILQARLAAHGYDILTASDGEQAVSIARERQPDLMLLDVMMPKMDGIAVCRHLKGDPSLPFMPIILITAKSDSKDVVAGLEAGAEEYLTKPVDQQALVARVKSMLKIKDLHDTTQEQAAQLSEWNRKLEELNRTLEDRVDRQIQQIERLNRLRRFLSPSVAEMVISEHKLFDPEEAHREEIAIVCCDLRGFTAFAETAQPEETLKVLRQYQKVIGRLVTEYDGTIDHFAGDGIVVFLNDPVKCEQPARRAVELAVSMREGVGELIVGWKSRGHDLGFGVGLSFGYASIGMVGFEGRYEYAATGPNVCLAARLCDKAEDGQVLVSQQVHAELEENVQAECIGRVEYKGFHKRMPTYNVLAL
jgi:DNA-binding response OmpR family regulator